MYTYIYIYLYIYIYKLAYVEASISIAAIIIYFLVFTFIVIMFVAMFRQPGTTVCCVPPWGNSFLAVPYCTLTCYFLGSVLIHICCREKHMSRAQVGFRAVLFPFDLPS